VSPTTSIGLVGWPNAAGCTGIFLREKGGNKRMSRNRNHIKRKEWRGRDREIEMKNPPGIYLDLDEVRKAGVCTPPSTSIFRLSNPR
jgi:hypothetical protein